MKEIQLTQGKVALVDDDDFELLNKHRWYYAPRNGNEYAVACINRKTVKMHRMILGLTDPTVFVDHKDMDGLNNQRANLRLCDRFGNARNTRSKKGSTSKFLGVSWKTAKQRWYAGIRANGRHIYLGMSKSEVAAAYMYNEGAKKYFGEFASLNEI